MQLSFKHSVCIITISDGDGEFKGETLKKIKKKRKKKLTMRTLENEINVFLNFGLSDYGRFMLMNVTQKKKQSIFNPLKQRVKFNSNLQKNLFDKVVSSFFFLLLLASNYNVSL